jgi:hypothetical protein
VERETNEKVVEEDKGRLRSEMFFNWNGYPRCCWKHTSLTECTDATVKLKIFTSYSVCPAVDSLTLVPHEQKPDMFFNEAPMFYKILVLNKNSKVQLNHLLYFSIDPDVHQN